jgi:hypothetical protein
MPSRVGRRQFISALGGAPSRGRSKIGLSRRSRWSGLFAPLGRYQSSKPEFANGAQALLLFSSRTAGRLSRFRQVHDIARRETLVRSGFLAELRNTHSISQLSA